MDLTFGFLENKIASETEFQLDLDSFSSPFCQLGHNNSQLI
jgi:hypothetical protein